MKNTTFSRLNLHPSPFKESDLTKGLYIVCLYTNRVPPHIGLIFNGRYHSLTIKGIELNIEIETLLRTIQQKKIESAFLEIKPHPVYSIQHLEDVFLHLLKEKPRIEAGKNTCLNPLKTFFEDFYAIHPEPDSIIFDFLKTLNVNHFILTVYLLNLNTEFLELPVYSKTELEKEINQVREQIDS